MVARDDTKISYFILNIQYSFYWYLYELGKIQVLRDNITQTL